MDTTALKNKIKELTETLEVLLKNEESNHDLSIHPMQKIGEKNKATLGVHSSKDLIKKAKAAALLLKMPLSHLVYDALTEKFDALEKTTGKKIVPLSDNVRLPYGPRLKSPISKIQKALSALEIATKEYSERTNTKWDIT